MEEIINSYEVVIKDADLDLVGNINQKDYVKTWIIFAHGSGSSHKSLRNMNVARELARAGHGTLLFDLLTEDEADIVENRFNIPLLANRLLMATRWLMNSKFYKHKTPIGFFGASTGAAAALYAASNFTPNNLIYSVISRGGRPDLVDEKTLSSIFTPTLLIVGAEDREVIELNKVAAQYLLNARLTLVPRATHLFSEPGAMDEVTRLAVEWFDNHTPNISEHIR